MLERSFRRQNLIQEVKQERRPVPPKPAAPDAPPNPFLPVPPGQGTSPSNSMEAYFEDLTREVPQMADTQVNVPEGMPPARPSAPARPSEEQRPRPSENDPIEIRNRAQARYDELVNQMLNGGSPSREEFDQVQQLLDFYRPFDHYSDGKWWDSAGNQLVVVDGNLVRFDQSGKYIPPVGVVDEPTYISLNRPGTVEGRQVDGTVALPGRPGLLLLTRISSPDGDPAKSWYVAWQKDPTSPTADANGDDTVALIVEDQDGFHQVTNAPTLGSLQAGVATVLDPVPGLNGPDGMGGNGGKPIPAKPPTVTAPPVKPEITVPGQKPPTPPKPADPAPKPPPAKKPPHTHDPDFPELPEIQYPGADDHDPSEESPPEPETPGAPTDPSAPPQFDPFDPGYPHGPDDPSRIPDPTPQPAPSDDDEEQPGPHLPRAQAEPDEPPAWQEDYNRWLEGEDQRQQEKEEQQEEAWGRQPGERRQPDEELGQVRTPNRWNNVPNGYQDPAVLNAAKNRAHIFWGDSDNPDGGGHFYRSGRPGKTVFPERWNTEQIIAYAEDLARNPDSDPVRKGRDGNWKIEGTRDGVDFYVYVDDDGNILSAVPTGGDGVEINDAEGRPRELS
ncbi:EndoU domain-containing protein [Nocardia sp. NPDC050710]|uniref:EndoU domain-containing protein n=1 Tax=Nocardia sp. NPDC050710 TaxID=3157220 RepID=UPI003409C93E